MMQDRDAQFNPLPTGPFWWMHERNVKSIFRPLEISQLIEFLAMFTAVEFVNCASENP